MSIKVGIVALLEAKPGKEETLAELLRSAQALVAQEPGTVVWYAFRSGPHSFGLFDGFADEAGRKAHLEGHIAAALLGAQTSCSRGRPTSVTSTCSPRSDRVPPAGARRRPRWARARPRRSAACALSTRGFLCTKNSESCPGPRLSRRSRQL
jgi:quinol monooxygenase YgiN